MIRQWHHDPPPLKHKHGGPGWIDWTVPWLIIATGLVIFYFGANYYVSTQTRSVQARPTEQSSDPVQQGHPSLDKAWERYRKAGGTGEGRSKFFDDDYKPPPCDPEQVLEGGC